MGSCPLVKALLASWALRAAAAGAKGGKGSSGSQPGEAPEHKASRPASEGKARGSPYIEELTAETFMEKVVKVANGTDNPLYAPFVMFHMPWCDHCQKTIPELEETAEKVAKVAEQGQLRQYPAVPRFFMLSCAAKGTDEICDNHTGKSYPSLVIFRDRRALKFNRPRLASVITWWTFRVTRPAVLATKSRAFVDSTAEQEVVFLLHLRSESGSDAHLLRFWEHLALDYIEQYSFLYTVDDTPLGKSLGAVPSVHVLGPALLGLQPLPLEGPLDRASLKAWVNYNQFPPVTAVSPWAFGEMRRSELTVVTLVHAGNAMARRARKEFEEKAVELRKNGKYLFSTLNSTDEDNAYFLSSTFPLLAPSVNPLPRIFAFSAAGGRLRHWEDPEFPSVDRLTIEAIEGLLSSPEAYHDESLASWVKERRKLVYRFASRSWTSLLLAVSIPSLSCLFIYACCQAVFQALCAPDEPMGEEVGKHDHVD